MSSHFVWINRSKESLTLNLKATEGKEILEKVLKDADVLIQNLAPGALERLGFTSDRLHEINERLIICNISGYGSYGPYVNKKAYDLLIQCESGLLSITGTEEQPSKAGISVADIAAGMYAFSGILSSIIKRSKTGRGEVLDISMLEALGEWMGYPYYYSKYGNVEPQRVGAKHATIFPYGPFKTGDGETVFLAIQNEREWKIFCEHILENKELAELPDYINNSLRVENQGALKIEIEKALQDKTLDIVLNELERHKIANAQLKTMSQFADHIQLKERNRFFDVETPVGVVQALLPPIVKNENELKNTPIPKVGEHTESILKEIGIQTERIKILKENNVI